MKIRLILIDVGLADSLMQIRSTGEDCCET